MATGLQGLSDGMDQAVTDNSDLHHALEVDSNRHRIETTSVTDISKMLKGNPKLRRSAMLLEQNRNAAYRLADEQFQEVSIDYTGRKSSNRLQGIAELSLLVHQLNNSIPQPSGGNSAALEAYQRAERLYQRTIHVLPKHGAHEASDSSDANVAEEDETVYSINADMVENDEAVSSFNTDMEQADEDVSSLNANLVVAAEDVPSPNADMDEADECSPCSTMTMSAPPSPGVGDRLARRPLAAEAASDDALPSNPPAQTAEYDHRILAERPRRGAPVNYDVTSKTGFMQAASQRNRGLPSTEPEHRRTPRKMRTKSTGDENMSPSDAAESEGELDLRAHIPKSQPRSHKKRRLDASIHDRSQTKY